MFLVIISSPLSAAYLVGVTSCCLPVPVPFMYLISLSSPCLLPWHSLYLLLLCLPPCLSLPCMGEPIIKNKKLTFKEREKKTSSHYCRQNKILWHETLALGEFGFCAFGSLHITRAHTPPCARPHYCFSISTSSLPCPSPTHSCLPHLPAPPTLVSSSSSTFKPVCVLHRWTGAWEKEDGTGADLTLLLSTHGEHICETISGQDKTWT